MVIFGNTNTNHMSDKFHQLYNSDSSLFQKEVKKKMCVGEEGKPLIQEVCRNYEQEAMLNMRHIKLCTTCDKMGGVLRIMKFHVMIIGAMSIGTQIFDTQLSRNK